MGLILGGNRNELDLGVQLVHMVSGEDYLGHVYVDSEDKMYIIERPITIHVQLDETGRFQISPMPLRPFLKKVDQLTLDSAHVMWIKPVTEQMERLWQQATSEIAIPTPGDATKILQSK